ncbi:unnamed protein product [Musa acuminata var. zebrina]
MHTDVIGVVEAIGEPPGGSSSRVIDSPGREVDLRCIAGQEVVVPDVDGGVSEHKDRSVEREITNRLRRRKVVVFFAIGNELKVVFFWFHK